jgi:penicillin-binding protein 1A
MTEDFDFEFDVDRGRSPSGTRSREEAQTAPDEGSGAEPFELDFGFDNGAADADAEGESGNGTAGGEDNGREALGSGRRFRPSSSRGNGAPGNGSAASGERGRTQRQRDADAGGNGARGYVQRVRKLLNRRPPSLFPEHERWSEEHAGNGGEASPFDEAFTEDSVAGPNGEHAADAAEPPAEGPGDLLEPPAEHPVDLVEPPDQAPPEQPRREEHSARDAGEPGRPPTSEGRALAREARQRATKQSPFVEEAFEEDLDAGRRRDPDLDFESVLEHQPQKSGISRRGSAVLYRLRGLLEVGRERLGDARYRFEELRTRVPEIRPGSADGKTPPKLPTRIRSGRPRRRKPGQVKRLRLLIVVVGLGALALASTIFGMMMAVAGDLPNLESRVQYSEAKNSEVFDAEGRKIGTLLSNNQRILIDSSDISPYMKEATVAIEDERFYEHRGVDYFGIGRAFVADVTPGGTTQGASTITMQFVKNALEAQGSRTVFQKLREAALAYQLERQWDKDKILTEYLNTIYFGEGAYGIEAAARTYFGKQSHHQGCGEAGADTCASQLRPEEAALLAAIISAPGAYSPRVNPEAATNQRNVVLAKMQGQGILSEEEFQRASAEAVPAPSEIEKPDDDSLSPYFTSWLRQAVVDRYGAGQAFGGGLDIRTTLDLDMQEVAESVAYDTLAGIQPTASVAVIENTTGAVKALVGGNDFNEKPFNLATNGHRQPGSAFKPFVLAAYLKAGGSPSRVFSSQVKEWTVPNSAGLEKFVVHNYEDKYLGSADVASATKYSDNSVFAEIGLDAVPGGPKTIGKLANQMGFQTQVSHNQALVLGAPREGFTPLEMAYAFNTIATDGERKGGTLDTCAGNKQLEDLCPVAVEKVVGPDGEVKDKNEVKSQRVLPESVAATTKDLLEGPVSSGGTGVRAQTSGYEWGKTGTTENNGDAWFCGGTDHFTTCVWVGHAQTNTPMEYDFGGEPVDGGTYPAMIWGSIMSSIEGIYEERQAEREAAEDDDDDEDDGEESSSSGTSYGGSSGGGSSSSSSSGSGGGGGGSGQSAPAPAPSGGGGGGTAGGTGGTGL